MRPQPGFTADRIERTLRCHGARQVLGHEAQVGCDPYWLPNARVQIDVEQDGDSFVVSIGSDSIEEARTILQHARAFARGTSDPPPNCRSRNAFASQAVIETVSASTAHTLQRFVGPSSFPIDSCPVE
jgi:hypothetical protein